MRKYSIVFLALLMARLLCPTSVRAADAAFSQLDGDLIARVHFVGIKQVLADPKGAKIKEIAALVSSTNLIEATLRRLSACPCQLLTAHAPNRASNDYASALQPLFQDLWENESFIEARGPADAVPEVMFAVRVGGKRAEVWQSTLSTALSSWTGAAVKPIKGNGFSGWELRKPDAPNVIRCIQASDWILFGWSMGESKLQPTFLSRIASHQLTAQTAKGAWLDALLDWPTFNHSHPFKLPVLLPQELPKMHLTVEGQTNFIRPVLVAQYPRPLDIKLEPWKIPTLTISNPIVSFTAMRGIEGWVKRQKFTQDFQPDYIPNQMVTWGRPGVPFETAIAFPYPKAASFLNDDKAKMMPLLDKYLEAGMIACVTTWMGNSIHLAKMPLANPYISSFHESAGDFLETGLFPITRRKDDRPFPAPLLQEVTSNPKMVCYDWEIGAERAAEWRSMLQLYLVLTWKQMPRGDAPAQKWLEELRKELGNCATEVTMTAPNELTAIRNGSIGLTGMEINFLCYWLDAPEFPLGINYGKVNFRNPGRVNSPKPKPAAPAPQPGH